MTTNQKIERIANILLEWGSVGSSELELDSSPCVNSIGNGKNNVSQLVEHFYPSMVTAVTYHDEIELGEEDIMYENLSDDVIDEIYEIMLDYEQSMKEEYGKPNIKHS